MTYEVSLVSEAEKEVNKKANDAILKALSTFRDENDIDDGVFIDLTIYWMAAIIAQRRGYRNDRCYVGMTAALKEIRNGVYDVMNHVDEGQLIEKNDTDCTF